MEREERIEHPERFQKEKPGFLKRTQRFLADNILWIPIVAVVMGLLFFFTLYGYYSGQQVNLNVDLGDVMQPREDEPKKEKNRLEQVRDDIAKKNQVTNQGRYDRIINGRDIITTSFGQLTYVQEDERNEAESSSKEEVPIPSQGVGDTLANSAAETRPVRVVIQKVYVPKEVDTVALDSVAEPLRPRNPFATARVIRENEVEYIPAFVYGDQTILPNSLIRLRLGESLTVDRHHVAKGTVFTGRVNITNNAIYVVVNRIERYNVSYEVFDSDYSHGIILENSKNEDMEEALTQSAYRSSSRSVADLPYDIARDVTQAIVNKKRQKQQAIRLNDGHPIFLAQK